MKITLLRIALIFFPILCFSKDFGKEGTVFSVTENLIRNESESTISECRFNRRFTIVPARPFPKKLERWLNYPNDGLVFLHGCDQEHIQWAYWQDGEFTRVVVKGCPYEFGEWTRHRIYTDYDHSLCKAFGVKSIPCKVTPLEEGFLVEEMPVREPALSVCISFSMPDETILSFSEELEHYGGSFRLQGTPDGLDEEFDQKVKHFRELGVNSLFVIDPEMFKVLGITEVPTLVITGPKGVDKVTGNVSIRDFLEKASLSGENVQFAAKKFETPFPK